MKEFILSREEMLALMLAVDTSQIVGIDNDRLIPDSQERQRALTERGLDKLRQRGLLTDENGTEALDGDLGMMGAAIAFPRVFTLVTRDVPGKGQQQFLHYRLDPVNVELTMPAEEEYRLAGMPDAVTSLARMRAILPVEREETALDVTAVFTLPQEQFMVAKSQAEAGDRETAVAQFQRAGAEETMARHFVAALARPTLGGTITFMEVENQQIVDARDLAMVKDEDAAWIIRQVVPGEPILGISPVTAVAYSTILLNTLGDLLGEESEG